MTNSTTIPNRLAKEKSPYLLQHAHNPVNWYPWSEEAFNIAKKEDKPIFLSIGYSTCHWCHVMERESFEDREVADVLNEHFIAIKVDREERPDVDTIYMSVCQAMTGHGGWPLTVMMTPDKKPFFAGTYFPKQRKRGMPGLMDILGQISHLWATSRAELISSGEKITKTLEESFFTHAAGEITRDALDDAYAYYTKTFDAKYGGFGRAPKFPSPHNLSFLLRYFKMTGEINALAIVEKTLEAMYRGGIYDHIGFGFARYSTDQEWLAPHFEKMLYDNALLAIAYLETYQTTGKEFFAQAAREIFTYVLRDMTSEEGAFYSAEDADSEGEEGKFYIWSPEEIKEVLGVQEGERFCQTYDITDRGNFEGKNIPNLINTGLVQGFEEQKQKLFSARKKRIPPFKDDKILTAWNGLMIAAMAMGSRVLGDRSYASAAGNAVEFIMNKLKNQEGRLLARYRDNQAAHLAYVDDYAYLIWGLIELYETTFIPDYLAMALKLNQDMLKYFWDEEKGGLFQYGWDAEKLITRPKEIYDGALPSGNSVAAVNFLRLAGLTGDPELEQIAQEQINTFGGSVADTPPGHVHFLMAVYLRETSLMEVTVIGEPEDPQTKAMIDRAYKGFNPNLLLTVKLPGTEGKELEKLIPQITDRKAIGGKATAFVCKDYTCYPPVTETSELEKLLGKELVKV